MNILLKCGENNLKCFRYIKSYNIAQTCIKKMWYKPIDVEKTFRKSDSLGIRTVSTASGIVTLFLSVF